MMLFLGLNKIWVVKQMGYNNVFNQAILDKDVDDVVPPGISVTEGDD